MSPVRALPASYGDPAAEYEAVRQTVGVIDAGTPGILEVTGKDRAAFLHAMLSNDVKALSPGQGCRASFLDVHGKVQALLVLLALDDRILVVTPRAEDAPRLNEALDKYLFSEKAYFRDATGESAAVLLAGPDAPALATRLAGGAPPEAAWSHVAATIDGVSARVVTGAADTGGREVWLLVPAADGSRFVEAARAAGARPVGRAAWESLMIESGTPVYGCDVDDTVLLPEIPLLPYVSYTKGCYIGQEVVVRIRDRGHVNREFRGVLVDGDAVPEPGAAIGAGGRDVGRVTSATLSFGLKRPIALGYVRREHAEPGAAVSVRIGDRDVPATVSALPFAR
ncbi:MAG: aminomethyl transferase family protein [Candidatus Rokubacteria bacterium]|nr:aminomethyl transferase family protein [Candidatus Rokubacteria bacterium]